MQVGFAVAVRDGQAEIKFIGRRPDDPRSLVTHAQRGAQHAVLMGRVTCRTELLGQLGECCDEAVGEDAGLALAAYRRWGAAGLTRLEGLFALVVWDGTKRLLLGSRDPIGGYPLFWTQHKDALAFGTCFSPLLQIGPRRPLDLEYLAGNRSRPLKS